MGGKTGPLAGLRPERLVVLPGSYVLESQQLAREAPIRVATWWQPGLQSEQVRSTAGVGRKDIKSVIMMLMISYHTLLVCDASSAIIRNNFLWKGKKRD